MRSIAPCLTTRKFTKHQQIFFQDEPAYNIFFLRAGHVKLYDLQSEGHEIILEIAGPGDVFGEFPALGATRRRANVEAMDDVRLCVIHNRDLESILLQHPKLNLKLTRLLLLKLQRMQWRVGGYAFEDARLRIIDALIQCAVEYGMFKGRRVHLPRFFTYQELAQLTVTCRQSVNRVLKELESHKLIRRSSKNILIMDFPRLRIHGC